MKNQDEYMRTRNTCCWLGILAGFLGNIFVLFAPPLGYMLSTTGIVLSLVGCYNWARGKARSPWFLLWGFLAPIGFLGLALLRDRHWDAATSVAAAEPN